MLRLSMSVLAGGLIGAVREYVASLLVLERLCLSAWDPACSPYVHCSLAMANRPTG